MLTLPFFPFLVVFLVLFLLFEKKQYSMESDSNRTMYINRTVREPLWEESILSDPKYKKVPPFIPCVLNIFLTGASKTWFDCIFVFRCCHLAWGCVFIGIEAVFTVSYSIAALLTENMDKLYNVAAAFNSSSSLFSFQLLLLPSLSRFLLTVVALIREMNDRNVAKKHKKSFI